MKKIYGLLSLAVILFMVDQAHALTFTLTGAQVDASYQEPTQNSNGTPLTDLDHTSIFYDAGPGPVKAKDVPASAATGGGQINTQVTVPIADGQEADVKFWATAFDKSGNESAKSQEFILRIDRLAPAAPQ